MTAPAQHPLEGLRVLVVEDRYLIAAEIAEEVRRLGGKVVGPAPSVAAARELLSGGEIDLGLLDVNLEGEFIFPLLETLSEAGTPFVLLTGFDQAVLPPPWRDRPRLLKPIDPRNLRAEIARALDG